METPRHPSSKQYFS
jgi:hypothetical protein